jgi:hypothetical protein
MSKKLISNYDDYLQAHSEMEVIVHNGERLIQKSKDARIKKLLSKLNILENDAKDTKLLREKHGLMVTEWVQDGLQFVGICKIIADSSLNEKDIVNRYLKGKR